MTQSSWLCDLFQYLASNLGEGEKKCECSDWPMTGGHRASIMGGQLDKEVKSAIKMVKSEIMFNAMGKTGERTSEISLKYKNWCDINRELRELKI